RVESMRNRLITGWAGRQDGRGQGTLRSSGATRHPDDLPQGYHGVPRGAELGNLGRRERGRLHPWAHRGRATPGRRDGGKHPPCGESTED
ncbi:hypothetical protein ACFQ1S_14280, partial [Kibdelosporangium lantanae]